MSTFSLTRGSEAALGMLASQAGSETLLLTQPARELRAELSIEPFTSDSGDQLLAVLFMREQRHSMTLQRNDGANVQHLADWIEAVANGTLDTAQAIPQRQPVLLPCCRCEGEAIAYCYLAPAPAQHDLHGVKCRHRDCQSLEGVATAAAAADAWNAIQREELAEVAEPAPAQDEREAFEAYAKRRFPLADRRDSLGAYSREHRKTAREAWEAALECAAIRPAQAEQQPTLWARQCDLGEPDPAIFVAREQVEESGYVVPFYAAPIAQTAPLPDEQAAFDAWYVTPEAFKAGDRDGWRGIAWAAWQARAALATSPTA